MPFPTFNRKLSNAEMPSDDDSLEPHEATSHFRPSEASNQISADRDNGDGYVLEKDHPKLSWKEREKARKARAKRQGLYIFAFKDQGQTHIEGRCRETAFITVDLQDEGFHYALAPQQDRAQTQNWAMMFKPVSELPPAQSKDKTNHGEAAQHHELTIPHVDPKKKKQEHIILGDLGIPLLHSGKSFGPSTSIRKGWLYELIGLITSAQEPVLPPSTNLCGFELKPTMCANKLASILQDICGTLFEFVTDLPDVDSKATVKGVVIMLVIPCLSHGLGRGKARTSLLLYGKLEKERLRFWSSKSKNLRYLLSIYRSWQLVGSQLKCVLDSNVVWKVKTPTEILKDLAMTLIHLLLQVGLEKPISIVKSDAEKTKSFGPHFAAELWVSLIHFLGECDSLEKVNKRKNHELIWRQANDLVYNIQRLCSLTVLRSWHDDWSATPSCLLGSCRICVEENPVGRGSKNGPWNALCHASLTR